MARGILFRWDCIVLLKKLELDQSNTEFLQALIDYILEHGHLHVIPIGR
jgi:hypothetical protein